MRLKSLHSPSRVPFRYDINGLRAWAVMAVLFFHFTLIGLPGGFAGVDVFFIISGYLMTAIIVSGHDCPSVRGTLFPQNRNLHPFDRCKIANDDIFQKLKSVNSKIPLVIMDRITSKITGTLPVEAKHEDEIGRPSTIFV